MKKVNFLFGSYKVNIDLNACDGIVQIIWRNKLDFYSTILFKIYDGYIQIGSPVQVSETLVL